MAILTCASILSLSCPAAASKELFLVGRTMHDTDHAPEQEMGVLLADHVAVPVIDCDMPGPARSSKRERRPVWDVQFRDVWAHAPVSSPAEGKHRPQIVDG